MGEAIEKLALDQRRFERFDVPTVSAQVDRLDKTRRRRIEDLSEGGVFLYSRSPQPVGTLLTVKLTCPGREEVLRVPGRVVRIAREEVDGQQVPTGMGIQFEGMSEATRGELVRFLADYAERAPRPLFELDTRDSAALRREVGALRARLAESIEQVQILHRELEMFEQQDEANRVLVTQLFEETERLRAANREEAARAADQIEQVTKMFDLKLKQALDAAAAGHEQLLAEQAKQARALLLTELEEQLYVERLRVVDTEQRLKQAANGAQAKVQALEAEYHRAQAEFERALEAGERHTQDLLVDLAAEQSELERANARVAELEERLAEADANHARLQAREAELVRRLAEPGGASAE